MKPVRALSSVLYLFALSALATPTFPACGTITTLQNRTYPLHNAGRTSCQPLTVHGRQIDPRGWNVVEFCACRLYTGSEIARPCSAAYVWKEVEGPSVGGFEGLRVTDYECWNKESWGDRLPDHSRTRYIDLDFTPDARIIPFSVESSRAPTMRVFTFLSTLALMCGLAASAVMAAAGSGAQPSVVGNQLELRVPKLERPPPGHMQRKREAQQMFTFGGYSTSISGDGKFMKLEEPIEANGHPHPWCQGFEGSNGYTEGQEPTLRVAHMDKAKNESAVPGLPQHICWFYNDFDCDPKKGVIGSSKSKVTHAHLTDLDKKNRTGDDSEENRNFPLVFDDSDHKRYLWIKAYGCMLYVDNPTSDEKIGSEQGDIAQDGADGSGVSAAELVAGQAMRDLGK
ncbi:hypothetical protein P171DRAFT_441683 [Karstenula rhodostoma CBS 690.94]|uniref:Uncharacterized protein n=1 Tax=Karstenula rhodostoma CBS 690.94 TaxID=1392251 RepID=A0A9P4PMC9_9PLEO|nr:hypothetical protein P171DRAFT_441683 [Karstenula rhodostoma CBS 690.94]